MYLLQVWIYYKQFNLSWETYSLRYPLFCTLSNMRLFQSSLYIVDTPTVSATSYLARSWNEKSDPTVQVHRQHAIYVTKISQLSHDHLICIKNLYSLFMNWIWCGMQKFWNVVLEKDGEDHLHWACEKMKYYKESKRKGTSHIQ